MKRFLFGWIILCILSTCMLAIGQNATTSLRGTIKDPSGAMVPGAQVTLLNGATGEKSSSVSNSAGYYTFTMIRPAKYAIKVSAPGFAEQTKTAELLVNQPATIDFTLSVQGSTVTVDVSTTAQTLNTSDATEGDSVGNLTIEALPMEGRDPTSLLTLQPGVLYLGNPAENGLNDSRSGSVSGARSDQGNVTLDGMDDNDQLAGTAFQGVLRSTLDSTEEFRVTTSNGTADSGRSSGAQIVLVTKSGTNKFHGALYEYNRPTNAVANDFFLKNSQLAAGNPNRPQKYIMNTFGGSLGGPILKDKLFFFFNYEGLRQAVSQVETSALPTQNFYNGEVGYVNTSSTTEWLTAAQVTTRDSGCVPENDPSLGGANTLSGFGTYTGTCGPNANMIAYFNQYFGSKGFYGTSAAAGDTVNTAGYTFASPAPLTKNTSIARIDYVLNNKQKLFFRGNLQKDTTAGVENMTGQPPDSMTEDNSKGLAIGHTWTPTQNIVNDLRYGFTRKGNGDRGYGTGTGDWVGIRYYADPSGWRTRSTLINVPVNNLVDTLTWSKTHHTLSFGGNWRLIGNNSMTDANSYDDAGTAPGYLSFASSLYPSDIASGFKSSYKIADDVMLGTLPYTQDELNYQVTSATAGTALADGAMVTRHYRANEYEWFAQDAWRIRPNLTVTYGIRHTILQTPYETNGQQVSPTVDTHAWFTKRGTSAAAGQVYEPALSFAPSGKYYGLPGYWPKQKDNFAPRLSAVYALNAKTTIRAGAGMYFDHYGEGIVNTFTQNGSFGSSAAINTPINTFSTVTAPRFTGPHNIGSIPGITVPTTITYPYTPPVNGYAIAWGIDNRVKTPYSYAFNLSVQRELPAGFVVEGSYVGRLGRHLFEEHDLAQPVNLVDVSGGGDYFTAAAQLSKLADQNSGSPNVTVASIPYFEDVMPYLKNYHSTACTAAVGGNCTTATQTLYSNWWAPDRITSSGETAALEVADKLNPSGPQFWNPQFTSLDAWSSIGTSSYNAMQLTLRHPMRRGLTVDFSYTLSKSLDIGSATESHSRESADTAFGGVVIQNSWNPKLNKAVSDFDTKHLVSFDWVYQLPVGKGKSVLGNANRAVDAVLGQWQFSGLSRWSSGLPWSIWAIGYTTDFENPGWGVQTGTVSLQKHLVNGLPQIFAGSTATTVNSGFPSGSPVRLPYPGEAGQRNKYRGDGYFDIDSALAKSWNLPDRMKLKFVAEAFNVGNDVRFDVTPFASLQARLGSGSLGYYERTMSTYRRMQFSLRLDF